MENYPKKSNETSGTVKPGWTSLIPRLGLSAVSIIAYHLIKLVLAPAALIGSADMAAKQMENSDAAYIASNVGVHFFGSLGLLFYVLLAVFALIWWVPVKRLIGGAAAVVLLVGLFHPNTASAYYEKSEYTEAYTILPNETAFWAPDATKDGQAQLDSEAYLNANRIALKRFIVPHQKLQGSGAFFDFYVPAGRLTIVDRTPFSKEWVDATDRGTSKRREGFPCQTNEGLNVTVGVSIGASVAELNAAKYLYRFGVIPPVGDRSDPKVIFNSVFYSRKLADVMDDVGRKKIQALVCSEISIRSLDKNNTDASVILTNVTTAATKYFADIGITLDFIGWADTFTFDDNVQQAINRRYIAAQDQVIAASLAPYTATIQALASSEALRAFGQKTDGRLPSTIVGLPPEIGSLMSTLLKMVPTTSTVPSTGVFMATPPIAR